MFFEQVFRERINQCVQQPQNFKNFQKELGSMEVLWRIRFSLQAIKTGLIPQAQIDAEINQILQIINKNEIELMNDKQSYIVYAEIALIGSYFEMNKVTEQFLTAVQTVGQKSGAIMFYLELI